jgi:DNA-binding MarR family transcriptional regulator
MVVARLVENRLVSRSAARNDARKVSISLTPAGRAILRKAPDAAQTRIMSALRSMSKSDLQSLSTGLESLTDVMADQQKAGARKSRLSITA